MGSFDYIFLAVMVLVIFFRVWQTFFMKDRLSGVQKEGWTFTAAIIVYNSIIISAIVEYLFFRKEVNYKMSMLGLLIGSVGLFLTSSAMKSLGKFWSLSIKIKDGHQIVRSGIYRYIRHPYYLGVLFEVTGFILFANSYYVFALVFILFLILVLRMFLEERVMISVFGEEYQQYRREIKAVLPKIILK